MSQSTVQTIDDLDRRALALTELAKQRAAQRAEAIERLHEPGYGATLEETLALLD